MIFIPKRINVGFQDRDNTYTGKLAYIIYFDEKGKLRKETSWQNWREENGTLIPNIEYDNEPLEGFVLNKKVGGYKSDWNFRQTYCRVYDPRGFEFEITIENLLWILENSNCIKGKGLEGKFIYGWDGKDLVLVPIDSPDYKDIQEKNKVVHNNEYVKAKDLVVGNIYQDRNGDRYIYMGKFYKYTMENNGERIEVPARWGGKVSEYHYIEKEGYMIDTLNFYSKDNETVTYKNFKSDKKYFFFIPLDKNGSVKQHNVNNSWHHSPVNYLKAVTRKFMDCNEVYNDYPTAVNVLEHCSDYCPIDLTKNKIIKMEFSDFQKELEYQNNNHYWSSTFYQNEDGVLKWKEIYPKDENYEVYSDTEKRKIKFNDLEDLYDYFEPYYGEQYLENGNLFQRKGKHYE